MGAKNSQNGGPGARPATSVAVPSGRIHFVQRVLNHGDPIWPDKWGGESFEGEKYRNDDLGNRCAGYWRSGLRRVKAEQKRHDADESKTERSGR